MNSKAAFWYQLFSALLFLGMAAYLWISPSSLQNLPGNYRWLFVVILSAWGIFRGFNAWLLWKKKLRSHENE